MLTSLACLLSLTNGQATPRREAFDHVVPLSEVCERLSAETGIPVSAEGPVRNARVLVIRRGSTPLKLLSHLAWAVRAQVVKRGSGYLIQRGPDEIQAMAAASQKVTLGWIQARLAQLDADLKPYPDEDQWTSAFKALVPRDVDYVANAHNPNRPYVRMMAAGEVLPSMRLLRRLIDRIGVDRLAQVEFDEPVVFSTDPRASQLALPPCRPDLENFLRRQSAWKSAGSDPALAQGLTVLGYTGLLKPTVLPSRVEDLVARLSVSREETVVRMRLDLFDAKGTRVAEAHLLTPLDRRILPPAQRAKEVRPDGDADLIPLSPPALDFDRMRKIIRTGPSPEILQNDPPAWLDVERRQLRLNRLPASFLEPEKFEPLDLAPRDGLVGIAARKPSGAFVAYVPDQVWDPAWTSVEGARINVAVFERLLASNGVFETAEREGATVLRPTDPVLAERSGVDRTALGQGLRSFVGAGMIGLRDWSRYRAAIGKGQWSPVATGYVSILTPAMRQFRSILSAEPVVFAALGEMPDQWWVSSDARPIQPPAELRPFLEQILRRDAMTVEAEVPVPDRYRYGIDLFAANGRVAPPVSLEVVRKPAVRFWTQGQAEPRHWQSLEATADIMAVSMLRVPQRAKGDRAQILATLAEQGNTVRMAESVTYVLTLWLPQGARCQQRFDEIVSPSERTIPVADLAPELLESLVVATKNAFEKRRHQTAETPLNPGQNPPPPR